LFILINKTTNIQFGGEIICVGVFYYIWFLNPLNMKRLLFVLSFALSLNIKAQIITTVAGDGDGNPSYQGDGGQATVARLGNPSGITFDSNGNLYIADSDNNVIRKVNSSGIITTIAGNGFNAGTGGYGGYSGDGGQATAAELAYPVSITFDGAGNLFIVDNSNSRIRKVNTSGVITTIAGNGTLGFSGDGGQATAANINTSGITIDSNGNIFMAEATSYRIRKINTSGIISTIAGNGTQGFSGDGGQATNAKLNNPTGVALDGLGNLYIDDNYNLCIRKINTSGIITTIAGNGIQGFNGDGGYATNAELNLPNAITLDATGNIYIADQGNNRIRKVNTLGIISTIAGNGLHGWNGDGGQATAATLWQPSGTAIDAGGNLFIADLSNNSVRKIDNAASSISQYSNLVSQISISPNPSSGIFTIETNTKQTMQVYDVNGRLIPIPSPSQREGNKLTIDLSNLPAGIYNISLTSNEGIVNKRVVVVK